MMFFQDQSQAWIARIKGYDRLAAAVIALALLQVPSLGIADIEDETGIKRAFLDRYLDCAEAPNDAARLACYDALLVDIPAWLDAPTDPRAKMPVTAVGHDDPQIILRAKRCHAKPSD
ncbi:MAG: hypothetical protein ACNA7Q_10225 [Rhodobacterales bacterium]